MEREAARQIRETYSSELSTLGHSSSLYNHLSFEEVGDKKSLTILGGLFFGEDQKMQMAGALLGELDQSS